jgi:hypothetical protein
LFYVLLLFQLGPVNGRAESGLRGNSFPCHLAGPVSYLACAFQGNCTPHRGGGVRAVNVFGATKISKTWYSAFNRSPGSSLRKA